MTEMREILVTNTDPLRERGSPSTRSEKWQSPIHGAGFRDPEEPERARQVGERLQQVVEIFKLMQFVS